MPTTQTTTTEAKEATMSHSISTITATDAREAGALSGFSARCDCGTVLSSSLSASEVATQAEKHLAWHSKVGR